MLVFVDESGDPGFKINAGSSPVFVAVMVIFSDAEGARHTEAVIARARLEIGLRAEFKFNKTSDPVRDAFFAAIRGCRFEVRGIVVQKNRIHSPHLRANKEDFYRFFVRQMVTHDGGALVDAKIVIDGSGDRDFRRKLEAGLRRQVGRRIREVRFSDSRSDALVQLADMCAGAIARSYRQDRGDDAGRWRLLLGARLKEVWEFG